MRCWRPIGLAGLLLAGASVTAQPLLTADEAVRIALTRPEIEASFDADLGDAEAALVAAGLAANPELRVDREAGDPAFGDPDETSITLSQTFPLGPRRGLQREAASLGVDAAHAQLTVRRAALRAEVLRQYYDVVATQRRQALLTDWITRLARIARIAEVREQAGDLSDLDKRRITQRVQRTQLRIDAARTDAAMARAELAGLLGTNEDTIRLADDVEVLPDERPATRDVDSAALAALSARRNQAQAELDAARGWQLPLSLGIGRKRFDGTGTGIRDDALLVEIVLPLPLFDRNQVERQRAAATWQRADAAHAIAMQRERLHRTAAEQQLQQRIEGARRLQHELVPQARELSRIAEAGFAEGEIDLVGLLAALDDELGVSEQALDAGIQARRAAIALERTYSATSSTGGAP